MSYKLNASISCTFSPYCSAIPTSLPSRLFLQVIAGSKLWHFVVDDADVATEFLKRQSRRRLGGEVNFISIAELVSDPSKKQPVDEAWIARKAPEFKDRAKPALSLIQRNTEGVQVRVFLCLLCSRLIDWRLPRYLFHG